jgi:hypothetical protein
MAIQPIGSSFDAFRFLTLLSAAPTPISTADPIRTPDASPAPDAFTTADGSLGPDALSTADASPGPDPAFILSGTLASESPTVTADPAVSIDPTLLIDPAVPTGPTDPAATTDPVAAPAPPPSDAPTDAAPADTPADAAPVNPDDSAAPPQRGVIRLLAEGHFHGVADVRLRTIFADELAAAGIQLPEPSPPHGNGRAYGKHLATYNAAHQSGAQLDQPA